ncbi:leucine-rich PPR motif-containing protein, mitochondrial [Zootermopsis nevadensis]|nr:leucine-rich PPR motif-containing protein, mitochondrial [Zootermopsis nevadensis]
MNDAEIIPTSATYTALLQGFAEVGDKINLLKIYREMSTKNISLNDKHIMKIVTSLVTTGHQDIMKDVLKWLPETDSGNRTAVKHTAVHLLHLGYCDAACSVLDALPQPTFETSPSFGAFLFQEMIKTNVPVSRILQLTDSLVSDGRNPLALKKAVGAALSFGKVEIALELFHAMKDRSLPLRPHYFWPLFIAASKSDGEKGVFDVLEHMQGLEVTPDVDTLADYALPHVSLADSQMVIRKLQDYGLSVSMVLTPVLAVLLRASHIEMAIKLCATFKGQIQSGKLVQPLTLAYVTTRQVLLIAEMLQLMTSSRAVHVSDWVGQFVLTVLTYRKIRTEPEQLCELLKAIHTARLQFSSFAADSVMGHLQYRLVHEKMEKMRTVVDELVNGDLSISPSEQFIVDIPHPRDMSQEDLECHLVELQSKDLNRRGVLRRLIQEYCRQGKVEKALKAKGEFEAAGYEFSAGMLAMLFDLMVRVGNLDEAETNLKELNRVAPNFVLDEHKIIDYATLLILKHRTEVAIAVLEQHAGKHMVKGGDSMSRNCWRLLSALSENADPTQTRIMLQKLSKLGYCSVSNVLLGPVVRAHLNRDDLEGAVQEFIQCAEAHKATPLQHELLCQLVVRADSTVLQGGEVKPSPPFGVTSERATELLQQVLSACVQIHGRPSTHVTLAVVLAEKGMIKELRRFLMGPQGKLNKNLLLARFRKLVNEDKLEALVNYLEAGKGIPTVDFAPVYMMMLQLYCRRGDCNGALSLWTSIQDSDVPPSSQFLSTLAALLRSHKLKVPFDVTSAEESPMQG